MEKRRRIWKKRRFTAGAFKRLPAGQIRAAKGCEMSAKILNDDVYLILTKFKAPCHQHTCFLLLNFWIIFCDGQYLHLDLGAPIIKKIRPFRKFCRISLVYGFYRKRRTNLTEYLRAKNSMTSTILLRGVCGVNAWTHGDRRQVYQRSSSAPKPSKTRQEVGLFLLLSPIEGTTFYYRILSLVCASVNRGQ